MNCTCDRCRAMCSRGPCAGTPDDIRALIRAGYGSRLAVYSPLVGPRFVAPAPAGMEGRALAHTNMGACTFFRDGLCEIHDMKPEEGRVAMHGQPSPRLSVMTQWRGKRFESVFAALNR